VAQDADARNEAAFVFEARQHHLAASHHALEQLAGRGVLLGQRGTRPCHVKCEQRELWDRIDDYVRNRGDTLARLERERAFLEQRRAIARRTIELDRQPDTQPGKARERSGPN
jgi:hypothetical protein